MSEPCCKVGRIARGRDLDRRAAGDDADEYLLDRWLGRDGYAERGLRPLTDWFNEQVLKAEYAANDRTATAVRLESEYETLRGDDDIARAELVDDLATDGIDAGALVDDFISKSTLQRHFTGCLGAEKGTGGRSDREWERERIDYVTETVEESVAGALRSLENRGVLPGATAASVDVPVVLRCPECNTRVRFETAANRGYVCRKHLGVGTDEPVEDRGGGDRSAASGGPSS
jgi:hypothetical protein